MSKFRESTIQKIAFEELKKNVILKQSRYRLYLFGIKEVWTTKKSGSKRADGLICFKKDNQIYTVSLEAKSHRTLNALISSYNYEKFLLHCLLISSALTLVTVLGFILHLNIRWYFLTLIGFASFIIFTFIVTVFFDLLDLNNHKVINVINQLKQYPANEQWIAYSKYTNNLLLKTPYNKKKNNLEILQVFCEKNRFGLMIITNNKVEIKCTPTAKKGNFLFHYCKEKEIKHYLSTTSIA